MPLSSRVPVNAARLLALAVAAALAGPARAQVEEAAPAEAPTAGSPRPDGPWRVSVSTGWLGLLEYADAFVGGLFTGSAEEHRRQLGVRLDRDVGRASFGVGYTRQHWRTVDSHAPRDAQDSDVDVFLFDARARWLRTSWVDLYSGGGLGFAVWNQTGTVGGVPQNETSSYLAFQLRLLGVDAGWEHVRLWGELGFGFEGMLLAGASYRF
jgi:hypothetical protein